VRGGEDLAGELVGRADVDEVLGADGVHDLVAERADGVVGVLGGVAGGGAGGHLVDERAGVELPLLASAVEQLDVVVAVELELPVRVRGEPVVVAAVEHDGVVVGDALGGQELLELLLGRDVATHRVLQLGGPVDLHGAGEVAAVVGGGVLVDLDEDDAFRAEILLGPVGGDEHVLAAHAMAP